MNCSLDVSCYPHVLNHSGGVPEDLLPALQLSLNKERTLLYGDSLIAAWLVQ